MAEPTRETPETPEWEAKWHFADWVAEQRHRSERPSWMNAEPERV